MSEDKVDFKEYSAFEVMYEDVYLRNLAQKLFDDGFHTLGDLSRLSRGSLTMKYKTSQANVERLQSIADDFGIQLLP